MEPKLLKVVVQYILDLGRYDFSMALFRFFIISLYSTVSSFGTPEFQHPLVFGFGLLGNGNILAVAQQMGIMFLACNICFTVAAE